MGATLASSLFAAEIRLDCRGFIDAALARDPRVLEESYSTEEKQAKIRQLKAAVILPKFEMNMAFGPTPGLTAGFDSQGDSIARWDFSKIGPYVGFDTKFAQPLNYGQYVTGLKAAKGDLAQKQWEIQGKRIERTVEFQRYYYGYVLALELKRLSTEAARQMQKAEDRIEEQLDEDEGKASQDDLLQIKAGRFEVDKAVLEAANGFQKAELAIRFSLGMKDSDVFVPADTLLLQRTEAIPPFDTLVVWMKSASPELRRLQAGLDAKQSLVQLEEEKLGPDFFLFGSFQYAKSWAANRQTLSQDAFLRDPVNVLTGSLGIGLKYKMNFWNTLQNVRKARVDYRQLKLKDAYALDGLTMLLRQQYNDWEMAQAKLESVRNSLRASEALLKGVAMRFDVDPSEGSKLVDAYKRNILMQKDFYFSVYQYNLSVAELLAKVGLGTDVL